MLSRHEKTICPPWEHVSLDMRIEKSVNGFPIRVGKCETCGVKFGRYIRPTDAEYESNASPFAKQNPEIAASLCERS